MTAKAAEPPVVAGGGAIGRAIELLETTPIGDLGSNRRPARTWEQKRNEVQEVLADLRTILAMPSKADDVDGACRAFIVAVGEEMQRREQYSPDDKGWDDAPEDEKEIVRIGIRAVIASLTMESGDAS